MAPGRQRRAIRIVQLLLVLIATGLLTFAGYSAGQRSGFDAGRRARAIDSPRPPSVVQIGVLTLLGMGAILGALLLAGEGVRMPVPARLEELSRRAEDDAVRRAENAAAETDHRSTG